MGRQDGGVILVVDDNADTNEALTTILEYRGYRPVSAYDGHEALSQLRVGLRPSVIVLDLAMPFMDGWTFLAKIATDAQLRDIPIVVYSAHRDRVLAAGVGASVAKCQSPDVLLNAIARLSPSPRSSVH
jgi:CheY-like chemotaxis protein